jgi:hypothetical protein
MTYGSSRGCCAILECAAGIRQAEVAALLSFARRVPNPDAAASLKMHRGEAASVEINGNECHEFVRLTGDQ